MNKLKEDFRVGTLGAAAGLFSICAILMIARINAYYTYLSWLHETHYSDSYYRPVEDLSWIPFAIWHLILSVTAALLAHRYLTTRVKSTFLLWQVIGIASLVGWSLTAVLAVAAGCVMSGDLYPIERTLNASEAAASIAKYVSVAFACNVFYGSVMKASSRQYTAQFNELSCEFSSNDHLLS